MLSGGWCLADHRIAEVGGTSEALVQSLLKREQCPGSPGPWMMLFFRQIKDIVLCGVLHPGCDNTGWDKLLQIFFSLLSKAISILQIGSGWPLRSYPEIYFEGAAYHIPVFPNIYVYTHAEANVCLKYTCACVYTHMHLWYACMIGWLRPYTKR